MIFSSQSALFLIWIPLCQAGNIGRPSQVILESPTRSQGQHAIGHNDLYRPSHSHPVPSIVPFHIDEKLNYFEKYENGSDHGYYRRSSCPGVNILANRGFINRSGRNITYEEIAQASRNVWNFGDDNVGIHHDCVGSS